MNESWFKEIGNLPEYPNSTCLNDCGRWCIDQANAFITNNPLHLKVLVAISLVLISLSGVMLLNKKYAEYVPLILAVVMVLLVFFLFNN